MRNDTADTIDLIFNVGLPIFLILLAFFVGRIIEKNHFRRLEEDELELAGIRLTNLRRLPPGMKAKKALFVQGECVIACDYYKVWAGGIKNLFGGRIRSFETLLERARREATVRMVREAQAAGAHAVWNIRMETSAVGGKQDGNPSGVEAIVYGTALVLE